MLYRKSIPKKRIDITLYRSESSKAFREASALSGWILKTGLTFFLRSASYCCAVLAQLPKDLNVETVRSSAARCLARGDGGLLLDA